MAPPAVKTCHEKKILCVGMCVLDIVTVCPEYPQEDTKPTCLTAFWQRGGNASNNCTVLRHLGCAQVEFLGMMSSAPAFFYMHTDCKMRGITTVNCPTDAKEPPYSVIILNQTAGTRTIVHHNPEFPILKATHFRKLYLANYAWIHFEGRNPEETVTMFNFIHAYNKTCKRGERITISLDLEKEKPELVPLAEWVHYVFIGKDLARCLGWESMRETVDGLMGMLVPRDELEHVKPSIICTWGEEGACCADAQGQHATLPAVPVKNVIDSLGAGDTFCAATIYALAVYKTNLPTAVLYGNTVAAHKVGYFGYDKLRGYNVAPVPCDWGYGE